MRLTMGKNSDNFSSFLNPIQGFQTPLDIPRYPLNTPLSGQFLSFFNDKEDDKKSSGRMIGGMTIEEFDKLDSTTKAMIIMQDANKRQDDLRREERDPEFMREQAEVLDDLQAKQMARAQKYGKESAFYGFMYQGLPNLMAQAAFSKYAFAPEMVKAVTDAYSRINASPAGMTNYMAINPMGRGIG